MQINTKLLPGKQGTVTAEPPIKNGLLCWQSPWNIVLNDQLRCGHKGQKLRKTTVATRIWGGHTRNTHLRQGKEILCLVVNRIFSCAVDNGIAHPTMCGFPFPDEINCSYLSLYLLGKVNHCSHFETGCVSVKARDQMVRNWKGSYTFIRKI